jgi:hypothetical protein
VVQRRHGQLGHLDRPRQVPSPVHLFIAAGQDDQQHRRIGIAKDVRVYAWFDDITVSIGTSSDLDKYQPPDFYSLPIGKIAASIVEIDIAKSNDDVYAWYTDGTASAGSSKHLDSRRPA